MKKLLLLVAAVAMLLPGCKKINEELDALGARLDKLEQEAIPSIDEQIAAINITLGNLDAMDKELEDYIDDLQATADNLQEQINATNTKIDDVKVALQGEISTAKAEVLAELEALETELKNELAQINATIETLKDKDEELDKKIADLKTYVDTKLGKTTDWVNATFATLEQYNALVTEIAVIKEQIRTINQNITNLETRLTTKINEDIASAVSTLNANIQQKVKDITEAYTNAVKTAKEELTAAYTSAIQTAISNLDASLKSWVGEQLSNYYTIAEIDALLATLTQEMNGKLEAQKAYLEGLINELSAQLTKNIADNKALIEALREDVTSLQGESAEHASKIAENATAISTNAQSIINNATAIAQNGEDIEANEKLIADNKALIEANTKAIAENKSAIEALKSSTSTAITKNATDIAQNASNIAKNASIISQNATAIANNQLAISQNATDIAQLQQDLATTKSEITEEYKKAIKEAIETNNGVINAKIATEVSTINTRIDNEVATINKAINALKSRVATLEKEVETIKQQIANILSEITDMKEDISALIARIQSVSYIPKYSDGKATVLYSGVTSQVTLDFEISPKDAVAELAKVWENAVSLKAVYTETRAVSFIDMSIVKFESDPANGIISVTASGENLSAEFFNGTQSASARLSISDGNNSLTSEYIPMMPMLNPAGEVTIISKSFEGLNVYVAVPSRIKNEKRRIRWGVTNIAMLEYNGNSSMPEMLHSCDIVYPATLIKNDTTLIINHHNAYRRNKNGEIGYYIIGDNSCTEVPANDPRVNTGEASAIQYYQLFQPGEPLVLMMSEVDYADGVNVLPTIDNDWGPGWYWYPYDYQAYYHNSYTPNSNIDPNNYWHDGAWYKQIEITLPGPQQFVTGSVDVNVSNLKPDGGHITFTPTGDTFAYLVGIFGETNEYQQGYRDLVRDYFKGDESLMQWFTTSEMAGYFGIFPYYASEGIHVLNLEEYFARLTPGLTYHVVVNAVPGKMVNGDLMPDVSKQSFQHITFKLPEYTLAEPELVVTAYESYSPYKVKFNIKNANPSLPVKKVVYAANYTREFASYMSAYGYTYSDIVLSNDGYANLSSAELAEVNSDFGYDMEFDVRENTHFTLAVMGWNSEGRPSNPDKEGSKAVAEATTSAAPDATPLDMEKLNSLKGDWTATATIKTLYYETGKTSTSTKSWKVSIGDLKTNNTLSADDYAFFEALGVNKAAADAYLAEFNEAAAGYNASVLGQNRVLCQGWDISGTRETSTASPWDLFLMEDYNASLVDYLFYDFGPKWFLQTDADGNIFVPVNYNRIQPLTRWYNGMDHYLCLGNYEQGYANYINPNNLDDVQSVGIPVEVSADGKTVTLKAKAVTIMPENEKIQLYPTMIYDNQGQLAFYHPYVVSEVVLTKGWNGGATPAPAKASSSKIIPGKKVVNGELFKSPAKVHSRTVFAPQPKVKTTVITKKQPTREEIDNGMKQLQQRFSIGR